MEQRNVGGKHVIVDSMPAGSAGLTDAELRASPVPVSTIITGVATEVTLAKLTAQILDLDTGVGTASTVGLFLALPASGGPVAGGTTTNPVNVELSAATITTLTHPAGMATAAKQDTGNTSLASIDGKITAVNTGAVVVASGSITVTQATGTNLHAVLDAGAALIGKVGIDQTTPGTTNAISLSHIGTTAVATAGVVGTLAVGGNVATNVAIGTNPINTGAQAVSAENTPVTATRMVQLVADLVGKLIVLPYANPENFVSGAITTPMTGVTSTLLIAAPAGSLRNYITQITVSNAHATVGTDIVIQDGSGGTTLYTIPAASVYGGAVLTFPTPLRQPTAATGIYCANVTTGASTKVSASGYKGV